MTVYEINDHMAVHEGSYMGSEYFLTLREAEASRKADYTPDSWPAIDRLTLARPSVNLVVRCLNRTSFVQKRTQVRCGTGMYALTD